MTHALVEGWKAELWDGDTKIAETPNIHTLNMRGTTIMMTLGPMTVDRPCRARVVWPDGASPWVDVLPDEVGDVYVNQTIELSPNVAPAEPNPLPEDYAETAQ